MKNLTFILILVISTFGIFYLMQNESVKSESMIRQDLVEIEPTDHKYWITYNYKSFEVALQCDTCCAKGEGCEEYAHYVFRYEIERDTISSYCATGYKTMCGRLIKEYVDWAPRDVYHIFCGIFTSKAIGPNLKKYFEKKK